ncbi:MAG TPA: non-ribosomal peptide synthetase [Steroidobacteraceae bacterium]
MTLQDAGNRVAYLGSIEASARTHATKFLDASNASKLRHACVQRCCDIPGRLPLPLEVMGFAAFCLVLKRYHGGEDVPVMTGRGVIRCALDDAIDCQAFLAQVRLALHEPREIGPLDGGDGDDNAPTVGFCADEAAAPPAGTSLCFRLLDHDTRLGIELTSDAVRYPEFMLERMCEHLLTTILQLRDRPTAPLGTVEFLSAAERTRIVKEFNSRARERPRGATLHGLVESQAARAPLAKAVVHKDFALTYEDLNERANRIAVYLSKTFRVAPGECVGIMLARSEKAVAALLGILKAGAAYVPIHPEHPWTVVRHMVENAGIRVLIVDSQSLGAVSAFEGALLVLDVELETLEPVRGNPALDIPDGNTAYVMHTSGSTGRPKGVMVPHRAIVNTILWRNEFYGLGPDDVNLQMPSLAFDSSVLDVFCVLCAGGTLVLPEEDLRLNARYLTGMIAKHAVTTLIVTPSHYKLLVADLSDAVHSLRCLTLAGEAVTNEMLRQHAVHLPGVRLFNEYGPAENAVCTSACVLEENAPVTIGAPIPNVQVFVLDERRRICPIGVAGEIYLGGVGLGSGYCNQPELTAERFIDHPVPEWQPGKAYRTGDRAYWRPDGTLEYVGRVDNQVKIRGVRIEIDEVEGAIECHSAVSTAAVVCEEDAAGLKYLLACVAAPVAVDETELRGHLREILPAYAVPDVFVFMPELPLTLNGKLDRQRLREQLRSAPTATVDCSTTSSLETRLLAMARDVLRRPTLGPDENVFDSGGNSLRVMELLGRIRAELHCELAPMGIYASPTVRQLAERLSKQSKE